MNKITTLFTLFASSDKVNPSDIGVTNPVTDANSLVANVLTTVYTWAGILCICIIIYAGYLYTTSNSNAQRIGRAKNAIQYALVGLIVVAMAFTITQYVIGRF